jgi:hypothetical protein
VCVCVSLRVRACVRVFVCIIYIYTYTHVYNIYIYIYMRILYIHTHTHTHIYYNTNYHHELQQSVSNSRFFRSQKQPLDGRNLRKTKISHYKIRCRVRLDILPGTTESYVEVSSTLVQKLLNLKTNTDLVPQAER